MKTLGAIAVKPHKNITSIIMKLVFLFIGLMFFGKSICQEVKLPYNIIVIVQKRFHDTTLQNYYKSKFAFNVQGNLIQNIVYGNSHNLDTTFVSSTIHYDYKNGKQLGEEFDSPKVNTTILNSKIGDTIVTKELYFRNSNDTLVTIKRRLFAKNYLIYSSRTLPKESLKPLNEKVFVYNKHKELINIIENYNVKPVEKYKIGFEYNSGIIKQIIEYKFVNGIWLKEKIIQYITKGEISKLKKKAKRKINEQFIYNQYKTIS